MEMVKKFKEMAKYTGMYEICKVKIVVDGKKITATLVLDFIPEEWKWKVVLEGYVNDRWIVVEKKFSNYMEAKKYYEEVKNISEGKTVSRFKKCK